MRTFFSRCSLTVPLLCALMVVSRSGKFTVTNVETDLAIAAIDVAAGQPVHAAPDSAITLIINPDPKSATVTVSTIFDPKSGFYVGVHGEAQPGDNVVWVTHPHRWHVAETRGHHVIYPIGADVYWSMNSTISPYIELIPGPDIRGNEGFWKIHAVAPNSG